MHASISGFLHYLLTSGAPDARAPRSQRSGTSRRCIPTVEMLETRVTPSVTTNNNPADFQINLTGGDPVVLSEVNAKLDLVADGQDLALQAAASSYVKITINAANGAADSIDLSGLTNLADFSQLRTITVNIDAHDTVNRGSGWNPAGSETINGQRFQDFTQGNVTLKLTDFTPPERGIQATLVPTFKHGKRQLLLKVSFADTGQLKEQFSCPFQPPKYKGVHVTVVDNNGDGIPETVLITAMKHGHPVTLEFPG